MTSYRYRATVVRWVDGDTVDLVCDLGFTVRVHQRFRLAGVNTPEKGQPGWQAALDFCTQRAPVGAAVQVDSVKTEKYGRYLATLHAPQMDRPVNQALLDAGLAVPYMVDKT